MTDYRRDMFIDVTALDVEWAEQGELALKYGRLWAEADEACTRAEEEIKFIRSDLILQATADPEKYLGTDKISDSRLEAYYRTNQDYKDAKEEWIAAKKHLKIVEHAKNEICFTRKAALENLVTLYQQSYFAGPKVPRNLFDERTKHKALRDHQRAKREDKVNIKPRRRERSNKND